MQRIFFILAIFALAICLPSVSMADGKSGTVTYEFTIHAPKGAKDAKLWIPYPQSDKNQDITNVKVHGNFTHSAVKEDKKNNAAYLYAEWGKGITEAPKLTFSFHVDSHYKKGQPLKAAGNAIPNDIKPYLDANQYIPCLDAKIVSSAKEATDGAKTILDKARAVYDWTITHTYRNPDVKGCGLGRAIETLTLAKGGKCADISSVFVTVLRAAGVPSRDVFGLRFSGKNAEITGDFHCWSEFYLPGTGWVQADPADVRKAMLVEKLNLQDTETKKWTEFFWNGDDLFRVALNRSNRGVVFDPPQAGSPVEYFMYPFAQVDGKTLDYFDYKTFSYKVSYKND